MGNILPAEIVQQEGSIGVPSKYSSARSAHRCSCLWYLNVLMVVWQGISCFQAVAFIHGHGAPAWHSNDMSEVLKAIEWETVPNYIDINKYPNDTWRYLGDARPRPGNPVAYGADVYNGSFNLHQVSPLGSCNMTCDSSVLALHSDLGGGGGSS